jgi:hypothetical protein
MLAVGKEEQMAMDTQLIAITITELAKVYKARYNFTSINKKPNQGQTY